MRASIVLNHWNLAIQVKLSNWYNELIERFCSLNDLRACILNCWLVGWLIVRIILFMGSEIIFICLTSIHILVWFILLVYKSLHGIVGHHIDKRCIASLELVDIDLVLIKPACILTLLVAIQLMLWYFLRFDLSIILRSRCVQNNIIAISLNAALMWLAISSGGLIVSCFAVIWTQANIGMDGLFTCPCHHRLLRWFTIIRWSMSIFGLSLLLIIWAIILLA